MGPISVRRNGETSRRGRLISSVRSLKCIALLAAAALVPACGKSHSAAPQAAPSSAVSVVVSPSLAHVVVGGVQTFSVSVSGTSNTALIWSVNGIPGGNGAVGTIQPTGTGAQYSPTIIPNPDPVTVNAPFQAHPTPSPRSPVPLHS